MLKSTAVDYSKYLQVDLEQKLEPVQQAIDEMLTRLEETETLLALVQEERSKSVGVTGSLTEIADSLVDFKQFDLRIKSLEKLIEHIKSNVDVLERKIEAAEEVSGLTDNTSKLKNLLIPFFKRNSSEEVYDENKPIFCTEDYFSNDELI